MIEEANAEPTYAEASADKAQGDSFRQARRPLHHCGGKTLLQYFLLDALSKLDNNGGGSLTKWEPRSARGKRGAEENAISAKRTQIGCGQLDVEVIGGAKLTTN